MHLEAWLREVVELAQSESHWEGCEFITVPFNKQLGFVIATEVAYESERTGGYGWAFKQRPKLAIGFDRLSWPNRHSI